MFFAKALNLLAYVICRQLQTLWPYSQSYQQSLMKGPDLIVFLSLFGLLAFSINHKAAKEPVEAVPVPFAPNRAASCQKLAGNLQARQLDENADTKPV